MADEGSCCSFPHGRMNEQTSPPAGWYPDPEDSGSTRYWDGTRWTDQRAPAPPLAFTPVGVPVPVAQPVVVTQQKTNGMAIASLVLGILWIWWVGSVLALIFGYVAKNQIDESGGAQGGRGLAIAGIVLGWVGMGALVIFLILVAAASSS